MFSKLFAPKKAQVSRASQPLRPATSRPGTNRYTMVAQVHQHPAAQSTTQSNYKSRSPVPSPQPSWIEIYRNLVDAIVQDLMSNGLTFIEAYEQVLETARLHPSTTVHHLHSVAPETDPEALLNLKVLNAVARLQRRYHHFFHNLKAQQRSGLPSSISIISSILNP